jgi:branched-chain amino acid transport system ATP-binding protein
MKELTAERMTSVSALSSASAPSALEVRELSQRFGGHHAVRDVSFEVAPGEVLAAIGPNGAGKTTLFNCITGVYRPQSGIVRLRTESGESISLIGCRPSAVVRHGVARTFQNLALFGPLTVAQNLVLGRQHAMPTGVTSTMLRPLRALRAEREARERIAELLAEFDLEDVADTEVAILPHGVGKRVELARAVAMGPRVLLLDEPCAGLNPAETDQFAAYLERVRVQRPELAVVLIEHDMEFVLSVAHRIFVLNFGEEVMTGTPAEVQNDPRVIDAYLGRSSAA